jgi:adenylate cyclase
LKRRLAAILAADVCGYSALVQRDELGTVQIVRGHINAFEPQISLHHGRVVKTMGDGFLAEFPSVVDAVACAAMLQKIARERNDRFAQTDQAIFRMGVHAGDILEEEEDIFGDGVNIASRLEGIAAPGTVAISSKVFEDVERRIDLNFDDLGPKKLKNIEKPVHVYQLTADSDDLRRQHPPDLPDKPSVAVLPLQIFSAGDDNEFLADGLTEDLTTVLTGVPWLFVIAHNSAFTYKGLSVDICEIGKELGVKYIVQGSLRKSGDMVRVSVQLVDASDRRQIWAGRYGGEVKDIFDLQDGVVEQIVTAIAPQVQTIEIQRSVRKRPRERSAYDLFLSALGALNSAKVAEAEQALQDAVDINNDYASAKAVLAWCTTLRVAWQSSEKSDALVQQGIMLCREALDSSQCDIEARAYAGYTMAFHFHDIARGKSLLAEAVEQCPSFAWAWTSRSMLESFFGDPSVGVEYGKTALRLNHLDPLVFRIYLALTNCYTGLRDSENALVCANKGLLRNPNVVGLQALKIVALSRLGQEANAKNEAQSLIARHPEFRVSKFLYHTGKFANVSDTGDDLLASGLPS